MGKSYPSDQDQRYYASSYGRFNTVDSGTVHLKDPGGWNRYAYVGGDPVNHIDPRGLNEFSIDGLDFGGESEGPIFSVTVYGNPGESNCMWNPASCSPWGSGPTFNDQGSGGGGGANAGGLHTSPAGTATTAAQYLGSIWKNCADDFSAVGINVSALESRLSSPANAGGIHWLDATNSSIANTTIGSYEGTGDTTTLGQYFAGATGVYGATAATLPGTNYVAVGPDYFTSLTQTQQIAVAIHEALHIQTGLNDSQLMNLLNTLGAGLNASGDSSQITSWILGSKSNPSTTTTGGCTSGP